MKRPRFFSGQSLTAEDFQAEQDYHIAKRRLHNRVLHGSGVVAGLAVSVEHGSQPAVLVAPGFALDANGNEILVENPVRMDLGKCTGRVCFVTIEYAETATNPVPAANGGVEFSRVSEGYAIGFANKALPEEGDASQLRLARLVRVKGRWVVDKTYRRRRSIR
jgi:hypothetical protein